MAVPGSNQSSLAPVEEIPSEMSLKAPLKKHSIVQSKERRVWSPQTSGPITVISGGSVGSQSTLNFRLQADSWGDLVHSYMNNKWVITGDISNITSNGGAFFENGFMPYQKIDILCAGEIYTVNDPGHLYKLLTIGNQFEWNRTNNSCDHDVFTRNSIQSGRVVHDLSDSMAGLTSEATTAVFYNLPLGWLPIFNGCSKNYWPLRYAPIELRFTLKSNVGAMLSSTNETSIGSNYTLTMSDAVVSSNVIHPTSDYVRLMDKIVGGSGSKANIAYVFDRWINQNQQISGISGGTLTNASTTFNLSYRYVKTMFFTCHDKAEENTLKAWKTLPLSIIPATGQARLRLAVNGTEYPASKPLDNYAEALQHTLEAYGCSASDSNGLTQLNYPQYKQFIKGYNSGSAGDQRTVSLAPYGFNFEQYNSKNSLNGLNTTSSTIDFRVGSLQTNSGISSLLVRGYVHTLGMIVLGDGTVRAVNL